MQILTFYDSATDEWVSGIAVRAATYRIMVNNLAPSILATSSRTRIDTLLIDAGFILRAFRANHALGLTRRRGANVVLFARAYRVLVNFAAFAVGSARRR